MYTPAVVTTTITSACPKCGIIGKSGKISCCGRRGSWFGNCGSADNTKLGHTWHKGIQACKTLVLFKAAIARYSNADQRAKSSNDGVDMGKSTAVTTTAKAFAFTPLDTSTPVKAAPIETDWMSKGRCYARDVSVVIFTTFNFC